MKVLTWNVNSLRTRLPRLLALLEREAPDVALIQEVKMLEEEIPYDRLAAAGYSALVNGQRTYNGVAILSRHHGEEIARAFPGDPVPEEARVLAARVGGLTIVCVYVINGQSAGSPAYERKLVQLRSLRDWITSTFDLEQPVLVGGDFNLAPDDRDVWDPAGWKGHTHATEPERAEFRALLDLGFADLFRLHHDEGGVFSWWDYRQGAFHKREGLRIDLLLGTEPLARRCTEVRIDRNERKPSAGEGAPSDHAPVIATFDD
ncbi:MAG TPA: exodeoxyribonuclease III [Actinomycetota bacterium]